MASQVMQGWRFPRHLRALQAACLRLVTDPDFNRLIVELPVRHGKSLYCTWALPAWHLMQYPQRSVIVATYAANFSEEWSDKIQSTVSEHGPHFSGVGLGRIRTRSHWTLSAPWRGQLRTASPSAGIAGKGASLIIADDLVKDMKEVVSVTRRNSLSTWFAAELESRLEPGGKMLLVMSRRHPDDQTGRLLAANAELPPRERWHRLTMPAIGGDGKALWPERWPAEKLLAVKRRYELDGMSYLFDSLYQQDPRGDSTLIEWPDAYFDGIGYDELPPALPVRFRVLALDPSKGAGDRTGDYSAWADVTFDTKGTLWCYPHLHVIPTDQVEDYTVEILARSHYDAVVVECNGFQEVVADNVAKKCRAREVRCPLFKRVSRESKEVRVRLGLGPLLSQRRIRLCAKSPYYRLALAQLREFPTGAHDDAPDSLNLAADLLDYLLGQGRQDRQAATVYVA